MKNLTVLAAAKIIASCGKAQTFTRPYDSPLKGSITCQVSFTVPAINRRLVQRSSAVLNIHKPALKDGFKVPGTTLLGSAGQHRSPLTFV